MEYLRSFYVLDIFIIHYFTKYRVEYIRVVYKNASI